MLLWKRVYTFDMVSLGLMACMLADDVAPPTFHLTVVVISPLHY
jgi:hypothetical protein